MKRYLSLLGALGGMLVLMMLVAGYVGAQKPIADPLQMIQVTTTDVTVADDGECSLSEAIVNANADAAVHADCPAGSGADTIVLGQGDTYSLDAAYNTTPNGLPAIVSTVTISGNGSLVERSSAPGTPSFRLLQVEGPGDLTLDNLTLRGGQVISPTAGGAIYNEGSLTLNETTVAANTSPWGGGIYNYRGDVSLSHSTVSNNTAGYSGGGIQNYEGTLALSDSEVSYNTANDSFGGGIINYAPHVTQTAVVTLENSLVHSNTAGLYGGGLYNESGNLTLDESTVSNNVAQLAGGGIDSQAIARDTTVELNDSLVVDNRVISKHGGGGLSNAAASNLTAMLTLNHSAVQSNIAAGTVYTMAFGGGIFNGFFVGADGATSLLTLNDSVVSGNQAINGGGIGNGTLTASGLNAAIVTLNNSTVSGNTAFLALSSAQTGNGGGIINVNGTLTLVNSTVSGNAAQGNPTLSSGLGGGIANVAAGLPTTFDSINATIAGNSAGGGGGLANAYLPPTAGYGPATVNLKNSLVAGNTDLAGATGCLNNPGAGTATLTSQGYNLEDSLTCGFAQPTDLTNTDPLLRPLADNGGPTQTHALSAGSPAIDRGSCAGFTQDQRGLLRPRALPGWSSVGDGCDMGAYEVQFLTYVPLVVTQSTVR